MKTHNTSIYLIYFLHLSFISISCIHPCKANDSNLEQLEDTCITKIKNFEKDMQATFKNFHNKISQELDLEKEKISKIRGDQSLKKIDTDNLHEKIEHAKATATEKIEHAKDKISDYIETGKDKTRQAIEAGKQKTQQLVEKAQESIPPQTKQAAQKIKQNIQDGTHKLHDNMIAGKNAMVHNLEVTKEKLKDGFQSGKHRLESGLAAAAQQLQHINQTPMLFQAPEYTVQHLEFGDSDRKIKISEEKNSMSTKYIIEDTHKKNENVHQQKDSNIAYLKQLRKYIKKHFKSKAGQIVLQDCIRSITYKPSKKHISVINSHKDQQEKYFIEVIEKKECKRFKGRSKKDKQALYNITYADNPRIIA